MADIKQRQAAANQAFFEQKAREYTRETGEKWTAKDVADYFEGTIREMSVYGTDAKAIGRAWEETAEYNGMNAPSADMYPNENPVKGWNDYKSATSITRDAVQWGINNGIIRGTPGDLKSLTEKIQRSFNNIDSLSSLPAGFEEAMSTSNAMLGRTAAPTGGTLDNLLSNRSKATPSINNAFGKYEPIPGLLSYTKNQQRMPAGRQAPKFERQLQSLQGQKAGTNFQRALDMLPQIDPADRIAGSVIGSAERGIRNLERGIRNDRLSDAIFSARMTGLPAIPQSSAIEQLRAQYQTGQAQRFAPNRPNTSAPVSLSPNRLDAPQTRTTDKRASGTTGFGPSSIPTMTPQGVYNVRGAGDGTVKAGFASTVPGSANIASRSLAPGIANSGGASRPSYAANLSGAGGLAPQQYSVRGDIVGKMASEYNKIGGVPAVQAQPASVRSGPANTTGANSYFADPRVSGYMPGREYGRGAAPYQGRSVDPSLVPSVSYANVPASVTWGGMASAAPTNSGFVNAAAMANPNSPVNQRNNDIGRALQEKAAVYGTGGPAVDVMPAAATRSVKSNSPPVDANILPAPSYSVSVGKNGVSTATPVNQQSLQVGANRGVSKVAELAAKVGPAVAGGIVAGPVGAAIGSLVQNAAQTFFGGTQNRQAQSGGSPAASFSGGGMTANPSGLGSGPVSYSVDPRSGNREITNSYGVTSTVTPEGFTYGGPGGGGSSGKG